MGAALERIDDHDTIDCGREPARFVDDELETVTPWRNTRNCRRVELTRLDTRCTSALDGCAFLNVLRAAKDRELSGHSCRSDEKNDATRVGRVLIEPSCKWIKP